MSGKVHRQSNGSVLQGKQKEFEAQYIMTIHVVGHAAYILNRTACFLQCRVIKKIALGSVLFVQNGIQTSDQT